MDHARLYRRGPRRCRQERGGRGNRVPAAEPLSLPGPQRVEPGEDGPAERPSATAHQHPSPERPWAREGRVMTALDREMVERVKEDKRRRRSSAGVYQDRPRLAFIVHSFNRIANIEQLIGGLRGLGEHELIVCEDGSLDGSHEKWMSYLDRPNDFLIHSNDLHEIRILDRAIRFARSDIVCLVQDDDLIPRETGWLEAALGDFTDHPGLAILGGFQGYGSFDPDPAKAKRIWGGDRFRFVHHVNIGPYFIRRRHYELLGGWEYSFSGVGEPGICADNELCLRAWMNAYQVGYRFVPPSRGHRGTTRPMEEPCCSPTRPGCGTRSGTPTRSSGRTDPTPGRSTGWWRTRTPHCGHRRPTSRWRQEPRAARRALRRHDRLVIGVPRRRSAPGCPARRAGGPVAQDPLHREAGGGQRPFKACSGGHSHSHSTGHNCNHLDRTSRNLPPT